MREQVRFGNVPRPGSNTASPRRVEILDSNKSRQEENNRRGVRNRQNRQDRVWSSKREYGASGIGKEEEEGDGKVERKHQIEAAAGW